MIQPLIKVGYWREPGLVASLFSSLPFAEDFVDPSWDTAPERDFVLAYLRPAPLGAGLVHESWMGYSTCRLCGKSNGSRCLTDHVFVWPEGLAHYVSDHSLRPDASFVAHILQKAGS
jgi:hypothetical protein